MPYFRVDRRPFEVGDIITPNNQHYDNTGDKQRAIEDLLNLHRPDHKRNRRDILLLFNDFDSALKYWIHSKKGNFYQVHVDEADILHRGDWDLLTRMSRTGNQDLLVEMAIQYWEDREIDTLIEFFVERARVIKVISSNVNEKKNAYLHYISGGEVIPGVKIISMEDVI